MSHQFLLGKCLAELALEPWHGSSTAPFLLAGYVYCLFYGYALEDRPGGRPLLVVWRCLFVAKFFWRLVFWRSVFFGDVLCFLCFFATFFWRRFFDDGDECQIDALGMPDKCPRFGSIYLLTFILACATPSNGLTPLLMDVILRRRCMLSAFQECQARYLTGVLGQNLL